MVNLPRMGDTGGFLVWITGLAGSGKTTLGRSLHAALAGSGVHAVLLDGDALREITGGVFGYDRDDRLRCAEFYSRLCSHLAAQGVNVICCTVSMFEAVRERNRSTVPRYLEVYLRASSELLRERNQRGLYAGDDETKDVVGLDLAMEEPRRPDLVFELGEAGLPVEVMTERVLAALREEPIGALR